MDKNTNFEFRSFIPYRITRLNARLNRQAAVLLEKFGALTLTQWRIILLLRNEDVDTLSEISDISDIDKGLLSRNLSTLVDQGHVRVRQDAADRRINRLQLTDSGETLHAKLQPMMEWRQQRIMRDLDQEEYRIFMSVMDRLERGAEDVSFAP